MKGQLLYLGYGDEELDPTKVQQVAGEISHSVSILILSLSSSPLVMLRTCSELILSPLVKCPNHFYNVLRKIGRVYVLGRLPPANIV